MGLGPQELVVILIVAGLVGLFVGLPIWAIIQVAITPTAQWEATGRSRGLWIFALVGASLFGLGLIPALIFLASTRKQLAAAAT